jgi:hypothetical protein
MNLYYFFEIDNEGNQIYGEEYFVMSDSLDAAKKAVIECEDYKDRTYSDIEKMGVIVKGINEVIHTELA